MVTAFDCDFFREMVNILHLLLLLLLMLSIIFGSRYKDLEIQPKVFGDPDLAHGPSIDYPNLELSSSYRM